MRRRLSFRSFGCVILVVALFLAGCGRITTSLTSTATASGGATTPEATTAATANTPAVSNASPTTTSNVHATSVPSASPTEMAGAGAAPANGASVIPNPGQGPGPIAEVTAKVRPGVVQITNEQLQLNQLNESTLVPQGVGSGVIFDAEGHVLTNNHVVAGAQKLDVTLPDGRSFPAKLVGRDPRSDLAVVQISGSSLPVIPLGDSSKLVVGQWVVAIGNALALPGGPTVTAGVVSALGRTAQEPADPSGGSAGSGQGGAFLFDLIQTDAAINPGNSGGPLVNLDGQVVGINTLGASQAESIGFAIAINTARPIADQLIKSGKVEYAYLGVGVYDNTPTLARRFNLANSPGVIVTGLDPQGPAAKAGLQQSDVITAIDGTKITGEGDLMKVLNLSKPGDAVTVTVARPNGQTQNIKVTLGTAPTG
ncbi:MAG TPA: trypsin-like peptidase domain-containing protein [Chloroflexota bacterium]|nr:trypsin-like peptidase domain-containing protein [Chloroflexota bacterium]